MAAHAHLVCTSARIKGKAFRVRMRLIGNKVGIIIYPVRLAGRVALSQWFRVGAKADAKPKRRWIVYESIFDALRRIMHATHTYTGSEEFLGERARMERALTVARSLNTLVLDQAGSARHEIILERASLTRELAHLLQGSRVPEKREALGYATRLASGVDSRGRINPGAAAAQTIGMQSRLRRRATAVPRIESYLIRDSQMLAANIGVFKVLLMTLREFVEQVLEHPLSDLIRANPDIRERFAEHCEYLAKEVAAIDFNPFRTMSWNTARDVREIARIARSDMEERKRASEIAKKMRVLQSVLELKAIHLDLERIRYRWALEHERNGTADLAKLITEILRIRQSLEAFSDHGFRQHVRGKALSACNQLLGYQPSEGTPNQTIYNDIGALLKKISETL